MATVVTYQPRRRYIPQPLIFTVFTFIVAIPAVLLGVFAYWWIALPCFLLLVGGVLLQGLINVPANPPHRGVPTFLGERYLNTLGEGWHIRLGFDFLYGVIAVKVERVNLDFTPENVRTPDRAQISVPVSITYTPDENNLIAFLNSGGEKGLEDIIQDPTGEVIREWAMSRDRGPQSWQEALQVHGEALPLMINTLVGRELDHPLDPDELALMRSGNGNFRNTALGIILNRVNITAIQVLGEVGEAAERQAKEEQEREGEKVELQHVRDRIMELTTPLPDGPGLTPEMARRVVQLERGKIEKEKVETKVFGVTAETFEGLGQIARAVRGQGPENERGEQQ